MSTETLFRPGEPCPTSGLYEIVGPRGGKIEGVQRTVVEGEPFPPTPEPDQYYKLATAAKH